MSLPIDDLRFDGSRPFYIDKTSCSPAQVLSDKASKDLIKDHVKALSDYQEKLFASRRRSVLIVFQAMDAAGKDSTLERLIKGINPQGCQVHGFKKPTPEELEHDFL
ncbi:MAG: polyphosphate kinase 2 family protein, partial [Bacteroidetes bacterium]|nr:polyphosphate kinase 2 family protein [Bacteroidota bacterium]